MYSKQSYFIGVVFFSWKTGDEKCPVYTLNTVNMSDIIDLNISSDIVAVINKIHKIQTETTESFT